MSFRVKPPEKLYYYCPKCGKIAVAPPNARLTCKADRTRMKPVTFSLLEIKELGQRIGGNIDIIPPLVMIRKPVDTITTIPAVILYPVIAKGIPAGLLYPSYWVTEVYEGDLEVFKEFVKEKIGLAPKVKASTPTPPPAGGGAV